MENNKNQNSENQESKENKNQLKATASHETRARALAAFIIYESFYFNKKHGKHRKQKSNICSTKASYIRKYVRKAPLKPEENFKKI